MGVLSDLDEYRRAAEDFLTSRERADYLHYAGHSAVLDLEAVFERHSDLFTEDVARELVSSIAAARPGDEATSRRSLALFALQGHMERATRVQTEEFARLEASATITLDGGEVGYRQSAEVLANEPDAARRAAIAALRDRVVREELTPVLEERWTTAHRLARDLGAPSYTRLYEAVRGVDFGRLRSQAQELLAATEDLYAEVMDRELRHVVGVTLEDARRSDIPRFHRAPGLDGAFPASRLLSALGETLAGLGIELRRMPNIVLDTEPRPLKDPRAFCAPVRVPDEVYLVIMPIGGIDDYSALFHEAGHALHFGSADRRLPVEFRVMGDDSVTETYAFLMEHLVRDETWLSRMMGLTATAEHRRFAAVQNLMFYRRYAAKFLYELELHESSDVGAMAGRYAGLLTDATMVEYPDATFLEDVDAGFYAVCYMRAWALEVALRGHLRDRFGTRWFESPRAGALLRELWNEGQRMDGDEIARELGLPPVDFRVLADEAGAVLG